VIFTHLLKGNIYLPSVAKAHLGLFAIRTASTLVAR